jgi:membrane peptidoglycan carboxypeptidase
VRRVTPARLIRAGLISVTAGLALAMLILPGLSLVGLTVKGGADDFLKLPTNLVVPPLPQASRIVDDQGNVIGYLRGEQDRQIVSLSQVPTVMRQAIIDIEDDRFYQHTGLDYKGLIRAYLHNQESGGATQGGSTLTQQYVKNVLLQAASTPAERKAATEQTVRRKLREARYALYLEQNLPKDTILERYLNIAYFGDGAYGIETAARHYFNVDVSQLTLPQAATLAGLVKNPSAYDPILHPAAGKNRRDTVLDRMYQLHHITAAQLRQYKAQPLGLRPAAQAADPCQVSYAPFYCAYVRKQLLADPMFGATEADREKLLFEGGLTIHTNLDPVAQKAAQAAVEDVVPHDYRAAAGIVIMRPGSGDVIALAENRVYGAYTDGKSAQETTDFTHTKQIIPLEETAFSAGSTFKPFTLAAALEEHLPLSTTFMAPPCYHSNLFGNPDTDHNGRPDPGDCFENAEPAEGGFYSLTTATWNSVNTYYIQLAEKVGVLKMAEMARRLGVTSCRVLDNADAQRVNCPGGGIGPVDGSAVLGSNEVSTMDIATAYSTFAAHGVRCDPRPIASITERVGASDRPVPFTMPGACRQVLDPKIADTVSAVLQGVITHGTGGGAAIGRPVAGKTGTAEDFSTASFVGYIPQLTAAVTIADPRGPSTHPLNNAPGVGRVYGGTWPASVWREAMSATVDGMKLPVEPLPPPDNTQPQPPQATVPNVVGQPLTGAQPALAAAGFQVTAQPTLDLLHPAGTVLAQNPPGGAQAPQGSLVTLSVAADVGGGTGPPVPPTTANGGPAADQGGGGPGGGGQPADGQPAGDQPGGGGGPGNRHPPGRGR